MLNTCTGGCGTLVVAPVAICSDCRAGKKYHGPQGERRGKSRPRFVVLPLSPTARKGTDDAC
jgi:hypothetical protein